MTTTSLAQQVQEGGMAHRLAAQRNPPPDERDVVGRPWGPEHCVADQPGLADAGFAEDQYGPATAAADEREYVMQRGRCVHPTGRRGVRWCGHDGPPGRPSVRSGCSLRRVRERVVAEELEEWLGRVGALGRGGVAEHGMHPATMRRPEAAGLGDRLEIG
jgi:hypothetical protein